MAKVTFENINKIYEGGVHAVRDFNLEIEDKEFLVFVGPSGCGKSTTLRMVAGLEEISGGNLHIGDTLVNDIPPKDRDIAMVFQNYALYPHMTVYKNMEFGLKLRKFPPDEIDRRVREAADILSIGELLQRRPKALSGGQRQRVAVGRAIVRKPKVFLFDEPLSNLDAKLRVQMRAEISKLHVRLQATMIYVTHDQIEAMTMGDRIVVMKDGIIQQVASPLKLYAEPVNKFVAGFIGTPPMNFLNVNVQEEGGEMYVTDGSAKLKLPKEKAALVREKAKSNSIILGIRPEDVYEAKHYEGANEGNTAKMTVEVLEPMGAETYVYINTGGSSIIGRFDARGAFLEVNEDISMAFDMSKAHFFDVETEQNFEFGN